MDHLKEIHEERLQRLSADITTQLSRIRDIPTSKELAWGIVGLVGILIAFVIGMLAIIGDRWDNGLSEWDYSWRQNRKHR